MLIGLFVRQALTLVKVSLAHSSKCLYGVQMNKKMYWRLRLGWARWRMKIVRSRAWRATHRSRLRRAPRHFHQLELPFR